jgi:phytoene desaturase
LQSAGIQTTIFEKRDKAGGRAYVYEDQGFTFDAGPTVITDPDCIRELFTAANKRMEDYVELLPVTPFYRLAWEDGSTFDYANDQDELDRQIRARNPKVIAASWIILAPFTAKAM